MLANFTNIQNFIQISMYTLFSAWIIINLTPLAKKSLFFSTVSFLILVIAVNIIPIYNNSSFVSILRGAAGDLSITSGIIMIFLIQRSVLILLYKPIKPILYLPERMFIAIIGLLLYLSTFGFINLDIYHFGYLSKQVFVVPIIIFLLIIANRKLGIAWLIGFIAYYFKLQSSNNLWDYMIDPILWLSVVSLFINNTIEYIINLFTKRTTTDNL